MALFGRPRRARINPNAVPLGALTAAGYRVTHAGTEQLRRLIQPWQARAFSYYDQLGEINYAAQFYSRMLSPLRLYAAELDEKGDWVESDDPQAKDALARIQDPGGGTESLLGTYGRLMFIAGETYLFVSRDPDTDEEQWEMLSTDELRIQSGVYMRYKAPSLNAEEYQEPSDDDWEPVTDKTAVAYRLWRRHPRYSMLADATMKGVLDDCEELLLLKRAVRARTRSRIASAGILAISEDFSYAPMEPVPDEDPNEDPFLADLTSAIMTAIQNEGAASAAVPIVLRGTTEAVDKGIKHIQIVDPTQLYPETGLRWEIIKRIAIGLDMPPEILLGMAEANHWTAWQVDEQTWKGHGMPIANQLVNDLNAAYYRPQLRADGVVAWKRYAIRYDPAEVINHPDRTEDAKNAYDRRAIGKKAYREALGIPEEAAPTHEELVEMIGVAVHDGSLALFGIPSLKSGGIEPEAGVVEQGGNPPEGTPGSPTSGASVEKGPPPEQTPDQALVSSGNGRDHERALALARMLGAVDLALLRAREVAGNRLKSLAKRHKEAAALIDGVPVRDIPATLGPELAREIGGGDARALVAPASELLADSLRLFGIPEASAGLVATQIERHAARSLFDLHPPPLPAQFQGYLDGVYELV